MYDTRQHGGVQVLGNSGALKKVDSVWPCRARRTWLRRTEHRVHLHLFLLLRGQVPGASDQDRQIF